VFRFFLPLEVALTPLVAEATSALSFKWGRVHVSAEMGKPHRQPDKSYFNALI
jgi:hypothetical protein